MSLGDLYLIDLADAELQPRLVESLRGLRVHELAAGFKRTLILTGSGEAQSVTHTVDQLSGLDGQLAQVSFGGSHMLALTRTGQVYTLGDGSLGQLGHGAAASCAEPKLLAQLSSKVVAQVVCGQSHSLALTEFGDVYSWGRGFEGQLGLDVQEVALCPKYVYAFHGTPIAQLAAGGNHSAALSGVGKVYCWGEALSGQVGTGRKSAVTSPALIEGLPAVKSISAGFNHTSALTEAGQMYSWGVASHGPTAAAQPDRFVPQLLPASQETPLSQASAASLRLPRQPALLPPPPSTPPPSTPPRSAPAPRPPSPAPPPLLRSPPHLHQHHRLLLRRWRAAGVPPSCCPRRATSLRGCRRHRTRRGRRSRRRR